MPDSPHATVDATRTAAPDTAQQRPAPTARDTTSVATIATDGGADNTAGSSPAPDAPQRATARVGRGLEGRHLGGSTRRRQPDRWPRPRPIPPRGVGFQNSAMCAEVRLQAARSYSLISPPRTDRRLIRCRSRRGAG